MVLEESSYDKAVNDIFAELEEGMDLESDNDLSLSEYMDRVEDQTTYIRSQPVFFTNTGVKPDSLINASNWSMPDNEEHTIGFVPSNDRPYEGFVTRSNNYCFLRLHRDGKDVSFFF